MRRILLLAVIQCAALSALTAPAVVGVSLLVRRMVGAAAAPSTFALIDAAAALTAMLAAPLCGLLADRTMSRLGRRRPWLLGGAVLGVLGSAAMAWAPGPLALAGAWMLTQAAYNAVFAAVNGLLAEGLAPEQRTRAAGIFSAASFVGTVPGLLAAALLAEEVRAMLLAVPVAALLVIVPLALRVADPPLVAPAGAAEAAASGSEAAVPPAAVRPAASRLPVGRRLLPPRGAAVRATSLTTFTGAVGVVLGSVLLVAPRWRRAPLTPVLAVSFVLLAAAMAGRGIAPSLPVFHGATALAGIAIGLGMTATRSLAYALLPAADAGFGLGLVGAAGSLAGMVGPLAAAGLLRLGELWTATDPYTGMYLLLALPALLVLVLLPLLRTAPVGEPAPSGGAPPEDSAAEGPAGPREPGGAAGQATRT